MVSEGYGEVEGGEEGEVPPYQLPDATAPTEEQQPESREATRLHLGVVTHGHRRRERESERKTERQRTRQLSINVIEIHALGGESA